MGLRYRRQRRPRNEVDAECHVSDKVRMLLSRADELQRCSGEANRCGATGQPTNLVLVYPAPSPFSGLYNWKQHSKGK